MLLPFQGAKRDGHLTQGVVSLGSPCPGLCAYGLSGRNGTVYITPRVSAHPVRLALGYVLLAFQAVMETGVYYTHM